MDRLRYPPVLALVQEPNGLWERSLARPAKKREGEERGMAEPHRVLVVADPNTPRQCLHALAEQLICDQGSGPFVKRPKSSEAGEPD